MYGFVNSALERLIKRRFGPEKWEEIRAYANIIIGETDSFQVNHVYKDEATYNLVAAASEVLGLDPATLLEMFGEQFLLWCQESGYSKTLQLLGRSLQDFLTNLDALHDHLSIIYPQMDAPSFRCTEGLRKSEFLLHYYSDRSGLENIVMGIVKSVAREFYNVEVEMKLLVKKGLDNDHSIFSIRETALYSHSAFDGEAASEMIESNPETQLISSQTFCRAFPFHIVFDPSLNILQVGSSLNFLLPSLMKKESKLCRYFAIERPRMKLTFDNLVSHINTIFILRMLPSDDATNTMTGSLGFNFSGNDPMRLRGQMIYVPESDAMLFLCSPRVKRLHDLEQRGLYLSDIPIHDATRGLLMMGQAAESEFTNSVRLEELIIQLRAVQKSLEDEKQRMSELLREMLPISVANSLMSGQMVEAERFDSVTILFSDIVGFTSICSHSGPMQVINMLNKLYSMFDQVVGQNQVYKVETIGDAYMVVGGLPERNTVHAECVANQALDMMSYCKQVLRPDNEEPITMRIGIHSGDVVAGIVGRRMPRYCLFGNTVNVASRAESNGMPGKIQVTEFTHRLLKNKPNFEFEFRGPMEFKNVPTPVNCYFLIANTAREGSTPIVIPDEPIQAYEFMVSRPTPPTTPMVPPAGSGRPFSYMYDSPSPYVPDINVIHPTPSETPQSTPPTSTRSSLYGSCPFGNITQTSPTPPPDSESDGEGVMFPLSVSRSDKRPTDLELAREPSMFMDKIYIGLGPLREDSQEDEQSPTTRDLVSERDNDKIIPEAEKITRKISDASNQSVESGIDSSRLSDTSKEGEPVRKLSDSSADEDSEYGQRRYRIGSVSKAVEFFDTWNRHRRTGLATTAYADKHPRINSTTSDGTGDSQRSSPGPEVVVKGAPVTMNGRPNRKSLDSQGSSGSNE